MNTPLQHFEIQIQMKMSTIPGMPSKTNNTASTVVTPTKQTMLLPL
jgi:hypothetical protein